MNIYTQNTDRNLRVCSLLSSVLDRSLRPKFSLAIENKADILEEHRCSGGEKAAQATKSGQLALVFVGPCAAIEALSSKCSKFCSRGHIDTSLIPVQFSFESPGKSVQKTLRMLERAVRFFHHTHRQIVLVPVASGVDIAHQFFLSSHGANKVIRGIMVIDPPHFEVLPFLPTSIPNLLVISKLPEKDVAKELLKGYQANACIVAVYPNNKINQIEWEDTALMNDYKGVDTGSERPPDFARWLWFVRTIAKFVEIIEVLDAEEGTDRIRKNHGISSETENGWRFQNDQMSRL